MLNLLVLKEKRKGIKNRRRILNCFSIRQCFHETGGVTLIFFLPYKAFVVCLDLVLKKKKTPTPLPCPFYFLCFGELRYGRACV